MSNIDELYSCLSELHQSIRLAVPQQANVDELAAVNRKGDVPELFDVVADQVMRRFLRERFRPRAILSEEGEDEFPAENGLLQFVIDPTDGSNNYRRGLPGSTTCLAALPGDVTISLGAVCWSMVGDYNSPHPVIASRGQGAWCAGTKLACSAVTQISDACLHFELDQHNEHPVLMKLVRQAAAIRSYCSTAYAILLVASGALDAHLDLRGRVTPESYLAASLVLTEAGGVIRDASGEEMKPFASLTDRRSIVAAATADLAENLLRELNG